MEEDQDAAAVRSVYDRHDRKPDIAVSGEQDETRFA
jgi:hypothetical protein